VETEAQGLRREEGACHLYADSASNAMGVCLREIVFLRARKSRRNTRSLKGAAKQAIIHGKALFIALLACSATAL
jgi:hypothetical protein